MFRKRLSNHLRTGKQGENLAVWFLRLSGYRVIERNYRCPLGEIDIIACKENTLVFVEVRTRALDSLQHPLDTIDAIKVSRTVQAARMYLVRYPSPLPFCRFDIIGITSEKPFPYRRLLHVKNAFNLTNETFTEGCRRDTGKKRRRFGKQGEWKTEKGKWRFRGKQR